MAEASRVFKPRSGIVMDVGLKDCPRCNGTGTVPDPAYHGAKARKRRKQSGLSLREVARRMKFSVAYLSDLELGRRGWNDDLMKQYINALRG